MTCSRCNGSRLVTIALPEPCATPDEIWCPECSDPPPPFRAGAVGWWWAKWEVADPETRDADEAVPTNRWEVVEVFVNGVDPRAPEYLRVSVNGVERSQAIDSFKWGPPVARPAGLMDGAAA